MNFAGWSTEERTGLIAGRAFSHLAGIADVMREL